MSEPPQATLIVRRGLAQADALRAYTVLVNDSTAGRVCAGETLSRFVPPGRSHVVLTIDWCSSNTLAFDAKAGDTITPECGPILTGWRLLLGFVYVTVRRHQYLWLRFG